MGPHSFKCGKIRRLWWTSPASRRASMGPHSFKCGKEKKKLNGHVHIITLQWGRTLSSAESHPLRTPPENLLSRFNGAALFQVRKGISSRRFSRQFLKLQWGRTLSSAERRNGASATRRRNKASMGPHSFKCGKKKRRVGNSAKEQGFNGAALFQVRKAGLACPFISPLARFNGAALFQVRKAESRRCGRMEYVELQWGRTLSSAERSGDIVVASGLGKLQWGRTLSSAERLVPLHGWVSPSAASMGPHSFKCGKSCRRRLSSCASPRLQWGRTLSSAESE